MNVATSAALAVLFFALIGFVGEQDYQDALASEAAYCSRLADGAHTDYLKIEGVCNDRL